MFYFEMFRIILNPSSVKKLMRPASDLFFRLRFISASDLYICLLYRLRFKFICILYDRLRLIFLTEDGLRIIRNVSK